MSGELPWPFSVELAENGCRSSLAKEVTSFIEEHLTAGNEGKARCTKFNVKGTRVRGKFECLSRHKPTPGWVLYNIRYDIEIDFDARSPDLEGVKICTKKLDIIGRQCVSAGDLAKLILGLIGYYNIAGMDEYVEAAKEQGINLSDWDLEGQEFQDKTAM